MRPKERVRLASNHEEPDRVPIFEMHINSRPASEILGHEVQGMGGADLILGGQNICYRNGPMFSPQHYERFIKPGLLEIPHWWSVQEGGEDLR